MDFYVSKPGSKRQVCLGLGFNISIFIIRERECVRAKRKPRRQFLIYKRIRNPAWAQSSIWVSPRVSPLFPPPPGSSSSPNSLPPPLDGLKVHRPNNSVDRLSRVLVLLTG